MLSYHRERAYGAYFGVALLMYISEYVTAVSIIRAAIDYNPIVDSPSRIDVHDCTCSEFQCGSNVVNDSRCDVQCVWDQHCCSDFFEVCSSAAQSDPPPFIVAIDSIMINNTDAPVLQNPLEPRSQQEIRISIDIHVSGYLVNGGQLEVELVQSGNSLDGNTTSISAGSYKHSSYTVELLVFADLILDFPWPSISALLAVDAGSIRSPQTAWDNRAFNPDNIPPWIPAHQYGTTAAPSNAVYLTSLSTISSTSSNITVTLKYTCILQPGEADIVATFKRDKVTVSKVVHSVTSAEGTVTLVIPLLDEPLVIDADIRYQVLIKLNPHDDHSWQSRLANHMEEVTVSYVSNVEPMPCLHKAEPFEMYIILDLSPLLVDHFEHVRQFVISLVELLPSSAEDAQIVLIIVENMLSTPTTIALGRDSVLRTTEYLQHTNIYNTSIGRALFMLNPSLTSDNTHVVVISDGNTMETASVLEFRIAGLLANPAVKMHTFGAGQHVNYTVLNILAPGQPLATVSPQVATAFAGSIACVSAPPTYAPSTNYPTTLSPVTEVPTTDPPTTAVPDTPSPTLAGVAYCHGVADPEWCALALDFCTDSLAFSLTCPAHCGMCAPTAIPTTHSPTQMPTTLSPSRSPSAAPSFRPTLGPSSSGPTSIPTSSTPSISPTKNPSSSTPTSPPATSVPSGIPTIAPSTLVPTTSSPSMRPTTVSPSASPTTLVPTQHPSISPFSSAPSAQPTTAPSYVPTRYPHSSSPTAAPMPSSPSNFPTFRQLTGAPVRPPNQVVTASPTRPPSFNPSVDPTAITFSPSLIPTTGQPTLQLYEILHIISISYPAKVNNTVMVSVAYMTRWAPSATLKAFIRFEPSVVASWTNGGQMMTPAPVLGASSISLADDFGEVQLAISISSTILSELRELDEQHRSDTLQIYCYILPDSLLDWEDRVSEAVQEYSRLGDILISSPTAHPTIFPSSIYHQSSTSSATLSPTLPACNGVLDPSWCISVGPFCTQTTSIVVAECPATCGACEIFQSSSTSTKPSSTAADTTNHCTSGKLFGRVLFHEKSKVLVPTQIQDVRDTLAAKISGQRFGFIYPPVSCTHVEMGSSNHGHFFWASLFSPFAYPGMIEQCVQLEYNIQTAIRNSNLSVNALNTSFAGVMMMNVTCISINNGDANNTIPEGGANLEISESSGDSTDDGKLLGSASDWIIIAVLLVITVVISMVVFKIMTKMDERRMPPIDDIRMISKHNRALTKGEPIYSASSIQGYEAALVAPAEAGPSEHNGEPIYSSATEKSRMSRGDSDALSFEHQPVTSPTMRMMMDDISEASSAIYSVKTGVASQKSAYPEGYNAGGVYDFAANVTKPNKSILLLDNEINRGDLDESTYELAASLLDGESQKGLTTRETTTDGDDDVYDIGSTSGTVKGVDREEDGVLATNRKRKSTKVTFEETYDNATLSSNVKHKKQHVPEELYEFAQQQSDADINFATHGLSSQAFQNSKEIDGTKFGALRVGKKNFIFNEDEADDEETYEHPSALKMRALSEDDEYLDNFYPLAGSPPTKQLLRAVTTESTDDEEGTYALSTRLRSKATR